MSEKERERAFRYDLFVAPDWSVRFDELVTTHAKPPKKGRLLEINCGTGARVLELASELKQGEVVGVDEDAERLAIARAKVATTKTENCSFAEQDVEHLTYDDDSFDAVVADASLEPASRLRGIVAEAVRVAAPGAPVSIKATLKGSFDEFHSIYWESLHEVGMDDAVWAELEKLINARSTLDDVLEAARAAGMVEIEPHKSREEFRFDSGAEFLESPFVADLFLDEWLAIVPPASVDRVRAAIEATIDRARDGHYFDMSAKAVVVAGRKAE